MRFELYLYSLLLKPPFDKREGLLIRVQEDKKSFFVEASPLPLWSKETLDDVVKECRALFNQPIKGPKELADAILKSKCPSVEFALDSLLSQLQKDRLEKKKVLAQGISFTNDTFKEEELSQFSTWKVKVRSLSEWIKLAPQFSSVSKIRLDANKSLSKADRDLSFKLSEQIDYIEEPGNEFLLGMDEKIQRNIPFALDESLRESKASLELLSHCTAYILKPTLHGRAFFKHAQEGTKKGKKVVLSSSIESPIGLYQIASLQEKIPCTTPWGLGTYRLFPSDFCDAMPQVIKQGVVEFAPITWINPKYLTKIEC